MFVCARETFLLIVGLWLQVLSKPRVIMDETCFERHCSFSVPMKAFCVPSFHLGALQIHATQLTSLSLSQPIIGGKANYLDDSIVQRSTLATRATAFVSLIVFQVNWSTKGIITLLFKC